MAKAKLDPNCAIKVEGVGKTFLIPKHKIDSVRDLLFNFGRRGPYDKLEALQKVSFEIQKGEFFGIIGRNGSGKSTLLKLLAGIYPPDRGRITVNGKISPFLELGVGFNPELTARENVYLNGVILGLTRKQIDQRFETIIAFAELERFVDAKLKNFSSGMYVRLAFSVAIQVDADILLMDEVLAVGDAGFQAKCFEVFRRLKAAGKTIVFVSHGQAVVEEYCDRTVLLEAGKVTAIGAPGAVFDCYNSKKPANVSQVVQPIKQISNSATKEDHSQAVTNNQKRWGNFKLQIVELLINNGERGIFANQILKGGVKLQINDKRLKSELHNIDLSIAMYDSKSSLVFLDKIILKDSKDEELFILFDFKLPDLGEGFYSFSINLSHRNKVENGIVYDHWDKDNTVYIKNSLAKLPGVLNMPSIFHNSVPIIGLVRMRNEELILEDTLDHLAVIVDGLIIYDDASTDRSVEIARKHKLVLEVIENKVWKLGRQEEETLSRQILIEYAQRYSPQWCFYADCDERFEGEIRRFLMSKEAANVDGIRIALFDAYMTKENSRPYKAGPLVNFRNSFGPEQRKILMIWRNKPGIAFIGLDQREPSLEGNVIEKFYCQHYGKALSIEHWEETCDYYSKYFPEPYKSKWLNRKGKAIHKQSDFGYPLYSWEEVKRIPYQGVPG